MAPTTPEDGKGRPEFTQLSRGDNDYDLWHMQKIHFEAENFKTKYWNIVSMVSVEWTIYWILHSFSAPETFENLR